MCEVLSLWEVKCSVYTVINLIIYIHTYTFTEPLSAHVGLNVEFVMERLELKYAVVFVFVML